MPEPRLVRVKQPVPEFHQGRKVVNLAGGPRRIDAPQEQRFRQIDSPQAGRG
jgi:hypothetical protein